MKKRPIEASTIMQQLPLPLEEIVIHCFFGCKHIVQATCPLEAHALMEQHYEVRHAHQIQRAIAYTTGK